MQQLTRLAAVAILALCTGSAVSAQTIHCNIRLDERMRAKLDPSSDGPARLDEIFCNASTPYTSARLEVSPDGTMLAHADKQAPASLYVMTLGANSVEVWSETLAASGSAIRGAPVQWDSSAAMLWAGLQEKVQRGGWAAAAVRLVRLTAVGVEYLPKINPAEGRLDAVRWIRDGVALVQLDTLGQFYRPEQSNPKSSIAIVDALTGNVRARLDYKYIETLGQHPLRIKIEGGAAAATILQNGKARAVLNADDWIIWTEGELPRVITNPYPPSRNLHRGMFAMTPDGDAFLVSALLQASGMYCEWWDTSPCPIPTPAEGIWASLHDATTGEAIWQMKGAATQIGANYLAPEISPKGNLALIALPENGTDPNLALVSMADGSILQKFSTAQNFGFLRDGTALWVERGGLFAIYTLSH
jgi:hypothetical protein